MNVQTAFQLAGVAHLISLAAMIIAPLRLGWDEELARLPRLLRQMCNVYSLYTGGTIVACGLVSLICATDLSSGSMLARGVCGYIAAFWGVRLGLQIYYDFKPYLTSPWLRFGYHSLTLLFVAFVAFYGWIAARN
jgi:hypothetical protein